MLKVRSQGLWSHLTVILIRRSCHPFIVSEYPMSLSDWFWGNTNFMFKVIGQSDWTPLTLILFHRALSLSSYFQKPRTLSNIYVKLYLLNFGINFPHRLLLDPISIWSPPPNLFFFYPNPLQSENISVKTR